MKTHFFPAMALAASVLAAAALAQESPEGPGGIDGPGPGPHGPRAEEMRRKFEQELNLTQEQKVKLNEVREERKQSRDDHVKKMKDVRDNMKAELAKEKPDSKKLMAYATQTADLVEEMTKQRVDHLLKIKKILDKEQFEKLLSREWHEKGHGPGPHDPGREYQGGGKKGRPRGKQSPSDEE